VGLKFRAVISSRDFEEGRRAHETAERLRGSMQTEATPRETFTLGVLFRYKLTVLAVAVVVILAGYVRIITQPLLFQATARLKVRFPSDTLALRSVDSPGSFRLPLLEEEVKSYLPQLKDEQLIAQVLDSLPPGDSDGGERAAPDEPTAVQRFRAQFLQAYYALRKTALSAIDALLFSSDLMITEREQKVRSVAGRLEITTGVDASHIVTVSYQNPNPQLAANIVNTLCLRFIELQKRTVKAKDEAKAQKAVDEALAELKQNRQQAFELGHRIGSATLEEAVRTKFNKLQELLERRTRYQVAGDLLAKGVIPFDKDLSLEAPILSGELEQQFFEIRMRYEELKRRETDRTEFYEKLIETSHQYMDERRAVSAKRDMVVVEHALEALDKAIDTLAKDPVLAEVSSELTSLQLQQGIIEKRLALAESDLASVRVYNKSIGDENVSENIALAQRAQAPPFPMPQYREVKLAVVIILGLFAGCLAALVRHHLAPRLVRRVRPRGADEIDVPLILLPDDGKRNVEKDLELDISFPGDDAEERRGNEARR
jgi:uncharacterized protein involved in exopolysaccharide biosynthesis